MENLKRHLPSSWEICELENIILKMSNGANVLQFAERVGYPISRIETIWNETIDLSRVKYVKENDPDFVEKYALQYGDILLSHINSDAHLGKTGLFTDQTTTLIHGINLLLIRPASLIAPKFLNYQFKYLRTKGAFIDVAQRAVNQSSINQKKLTKFQILIPPLNEQKRIVAKIEELFSELDKGVESLQTAQAQLKTYRQALLKHAFEGKLTAQWREENGDGLEPAGCLLQRIKAERQARYEAEVAAWQGEAKAWEAAGKQGKKPRKPRPPKDLPPLTAAKLANLPELPARWVWVKVDNLGEVQLGRQRSPKNRSKDFPTKYIRAANITENGFDLTDVMDMEFKPQDFERYQLKYGDILLSEASGSPDQVGKPALWRNQIPNCCFQNTVIRFRPPSPLPSEYFLLLFKHFYANGVFSRTASGVGINHLSANKFSSLSIALAPLHEQNQIVQEIESRLSVIDQLEQTITENLQKAEALRQAILKKAFAGELVPQDPDDEPAADLLAHIRAAKS